MIHKIGDIVISPVTFFTYKILSVDCIKNYIYYTMRSESGKLIIFDSERFNFIGIREYRKLKLNNIEKNKKWK